jgi:hypothetical protein
MANKRQVRRDEGIEKHVNHHHDDDHYHHPLACSSSCCAERGRDTNDSVNSLPAFAKTMAPKKLMKREPIRTSFKVE